MTDNIKSLFFNKNLQILFGVTLIAIMGVTTISPAFPMMADHFKISSKTVALLITVFTFPGIVLSPVIGVVADRTGRKKILVTALFLFSIFGTACAFTKSFEFLLLFRFLQGLGAAPLGLLNVTIIGDIFKGPDRRTAMGYNASVLSVGTGLYPVIGGAVAMVGWNYPFLLSALALPVGLLVLIRLENPEPDNSQNIISYFKSTFKLMKNIRVLSLYFSIFSTFILIYGVLIAYFPFLMKQRFNSTSLIIGIIISGASLASMIGAFNLGRISKVLSPRSLIVSAFIMYTFSLLIVIFVNNIFLLLVPVLIFGFANGINIPTVQTEIVSMAPMENRGAFMSVNSMVLRGGQTLGPVITGLLYGFWGIDGILFGAAIFSAIVVIILLWGIK